MPQSLYKHHHLVHHRYSNDPIGVESTLDPSSTWRYGNDGKQEVVKAFTENDDPVMLGLLVLLAVVVAPLTEEILFRGYLYPVAKRFVGRWSAHGDRR